METTISRPKRQLLPSLEDIPSQNESTRTSTIDGSHLMSLQRYSSGFLFRPGPKFREFYFENAFRHACRHFFCVNAFGKAYVSVESGESPFSMQVGFPLLLLRHVRFTIQCQLVHPNFNPHIFLFHPWKLCFHNILVARVDDINVGYARRQFVFSRPLESPEGIPWDQAKGF